MSRPEFGTGLVGMKNTKEFREKVVDTLVKALDGLLPEPPPPTVEYNEEASDQEAGVMAFDVTIPIVVKDKLRCAECGIGLTQPSDEQLTRLKLDDSGLPPPIQWVCLPCYKRLKAEKEKADG